MGNNTKENNIGNFMGGAGKNTKENTIGNLLGTLIGEGGVSLVLLIGPS